MLKEEVDNIISNMEDEVKNRADRLVKEVHLKPELLLKCYPKHVLAELYAIKEVIEEGDDERFRDFLLLALLSTLRDATEVDVGWPYILSRKKHVLPPLTAFKLRVKSQYNDLAIVKLKLEIKPRRR